MFIVSEIIASEKGATMVEFALTAIFLLFIFGAFIDIGLAIHRFAMLKHVTTEANHALVLQLQTHRDCSIVEPYLRDVATPALRHKLAAGKAATWQVSWDRTGTGNTFPVMTLRGEIPLDCYFLCAVLPVDWRVSASNDMVVERTGIGPGNRGCPEVKVVPVA